MPLIIITGYPCSGKTFRARQLASALEGKIAEKVLSDQTPISRLSVRNLPSYHSAAYHPASDKACPSRDSIYTSASVEKTARAAELSAIKRALSQDTIVIADGLNYIKGFRYQLWCEAKAVGTRCCTVHCAGREDEVAEWNRSRLRVWADANGEILSEDEEEHRERSTVYDQAKEERTREANLPESHTAIFGDRAPASRSSSLDGDDGEDAGDRPTPLIEESLKSLRLPDASSADGESSRLASTTGAQSLPAATAEPSSTDGTLEFPAVCSRPYTPSTLQSLLMRYEPPSPFSKWDTPLFTIPACDSLPPASAIWCALFPPPSTSTSRKGGICELRTEIKPHTATVLPQSTGADALQILERTTSDMVAQILNHVQKHPQMSPAGGCSGGDIQLHLGSDMMATLSVCMGTALSLQMLQRLRRRFTQIQRGSIAHGHGYVQGETAVQQAFLRFLNGELGQ